MFHAKRFSVHSVVSELLFGSFLVGLFVVAYLIQPVHVLAAWFGFFVSAYSVIANDSIQTIGTFLSSNRQLRWWVLWLYVSLIFFVTLLYSWVLFDGDVSHQRLLAKGFDTPPDRLEYLQLIAPVILLGLTRAKIPVSTSFLVLGTFVGSSSAMSNMIFKSIYGYLAGLFASGIFFFLTARLAQKHFVGSPSRSWYIVQWIVSGMLWSVWLQQDLANIAIFLPRSLSIYEFMLFTGYIIAELGLLLYLRGGRIQSIVTEKSCVFDPRYATMIDAVYAVVLYYFRTVNRIPMSTTWVFLGLLSGREFAMWARSTSKFSFIKMLSMSAKDSLSALIGFVVSIWLASSVNPNVEASKIHEQVVEELVTPSSANPS